LDPRHYQRLQNGSRESGVSLQIVEVDTIPLQTLLDAHDVKHVNYMSIDVEGAELAVLHTIDFSKVTFDIIEVECNYDDLKPQYKQFFQEKGFLELATLDWDILYIHSQSKFLEKINKQALPLQLSIFTPPWKDWKTL
jgi:hypothetical protein